MIDVSIDCMLSNHIHERDILVLFRKDRPIRFHCVSIGLKGGLEKKKLLSFAQNKIKFQSKWWLCCLPVNFQGSSVPFSQGKETFLKQVNNDGTGKALGVKIIMARWVKINICDKYIVHLAIFQHYCLLYLGQL